MSWFFGFYLDGLDYFGEDYSADASAVEAEDSERFGRSVAVWDYHIFDEVVDG